VGPVGEGRGEGNFSLHQILVHGEGNFEPRKHYHGYEIPQNLQ
jgi:hypothetical protein